MLKPNFGPLVSDFTACLDGFSICSCKNSCSGLPEQRGLRQGCSPCASDSASYSGKPPPISAASQDTLCLPSSLSMWPSLFAPGLHDLQTYSKPRNVEEGLSLHTILNEQGLRPGEKLSTCHSQTGHFGKVLVVYFWRGHQLNLVYFIHTFVYFLYTVFPSIYQELAWPNILPALNPCLRLCFQGPMSLRSMEWTFPIWEHPCCCPFGKGVSTEAGLQSD